MAPASDLIFSGSWRLLQKPTSSQLAEITTRMDDWTRLPYEGLCPSVCLYVCVNVMCVLVGLGGGEIAYE